MTNFLDKIKKDQQEDPTVNLVGQAKPEESTTAAANLQPTEPSGVQERPDLAQAHTALDNLLANVNATETVNTGIQNSQSAIPAPAFAQRHNFGQVVNGMENPGYYSSTKGKVKGQVAQQVGGRFYFPLDSSEELIEELDKLVEAGIYEKVNA